VRRRGSASAWLPPRCGNAAATARRGASAASAGSAASARWSWVWLHALRHESGLHQVRRVVRRDPLDDGAVRMRGSAAMTAAAAAAAAAAGRAVAVVAVAARQRSAASANRVCVSGCRRLNPPMLRSYAAAVMRPAHERVVHWHQRRVRSGCGATPRQQPYRRQCHGNRDCRTAHTAAASAPVAIRARREPPHDRTRLEAPANGCSVVRRAAVAAGGLSRPAGCVPPCSATRQA